MSLMLLINIDENPHNHHETVSPSVCYAAPSRTIITTPAAVAVHDFKASSGEIRVLFVLAGDTFPAKWDSTQKIVFHSIR